MESWMIPDLIAERDRAEERMIRRAESGELLSAVEIRNREESIKEIRARVAALIDR